MTDQSWSGDRVERWLKRSVGLERQLAPVSELLFAAAHLEPGESVLDVGCGTGPTTRTAAAKVGPAARVTGLDISPEMLAAAAVPSARQIEWLQANVDTWSPEGAWDVVLSRFGVMFFRDPPAAFATLSAATAPGGRICFAAWSRRDACDLFTVPLSAAVAALSRVGHHVVLPAPDAGPFSLSDTQGLAELLGAAGWHDVEIVPHSVDLPLGGGLDVADAAEAALDFGPLRDVATGLDEPLRELVLESIREAITGHVGADDQVWLSASVMIVTASATTPI